MATGYHIGQHSPRSLENPIKGCYHQTLLKLENSIQLIQHKPNRMQFVSQLSLKPIDFVFFSKIKFPFSSVLLRGIITLILHFYMWHF